jgi:hypothetical protein
LPVCLQFLARRQSAVRVSDLAGVTMGQKDMSKGAFAVWTDLLQTKVRAKAVGVASGSGGGTGAQRPE